MPTQAIQKYNREQAENLIRTLIDQLNSWTKFYDEGNPVVSDEHWDRNYFDLVRLENEYNIYFEDSPTQGINYQVVNKLNKVEHSHPMLSLDKTKSIDEVATFVGNKEYIIMAKMDGLTCSLTYENGKLIKAETRGNGLVGEDILHNALQVKDIPHRINTNRRVVVDGEVICTYKDFEKFSYEYKNPRNFASGSIRLLDSKESAMRNLSFIAWDCIEGLEAEEKLNGKLWGLKEQFGFEIVPYIVSGDRGIEDGIERIKIECQANGYPIDGIVFKYNKIDEYNAAGRTDHHFKGGLAYKFYDEEYETKIIDIEWTMGRTGVLTPVAIFEPVDIDGTIVSRASLHNISVMTELMGGSYVGQKVKVFKSNMIIPQISWADDKCYEGAQMLEIPTKCPICGGDCSIHQDNNSKILMCDNPDCEGKILNKFDHFCSKKGLDIKGLSKATLEKLLDWGFIETYEDIFSLRYWREDWIKKPGFGPASVDKILNAIEDARKCNFEKLIAAAGIPEIGTRVAKDLAKEYKGSYEAFREDVEGKLDFTRFDGIGEVMADYILNFDYTEIDKVYDRLDFQMPEPKEENSVDLTDIVFCITGKLNTFKNRDELIVDIESKGGRAVSSMSSKVNYLINNDITSTSAKNKAAKATGIPIITEEDYLNM